MVAHQFLLQRAVFRRVCLVERRADHGDGAPAGVKRGRVGRCIDAFCETAHNCGVVLNKQTSQFRCTPHAVRRRLARADDGDLGRLEEPIGMTSCKQLFRRIEVLFDVERAEQFLYRVGATATNGWRRQLSVRV